MELLFDTKGNDKQKLAASFWIDNESSEIVYGGSKGSGKSYLGASLIFGDAFIYPGTHYFIARKKLNDIIKYTLPTVYEVFEHWKIPKSAYKFNGQLNFFQLYNGSIIYLIEAKYLPSDPDFTRFGSMQMTRGWCEEIGEFEPDAFENLLASVGRWKNEKYNLKGKVLGTCNPSKNFTYKNFYKPHKTNELPSHRKFIQALPEDNKVLYRTGYFKHLEKTLSKNAKERLLKGNWEFDDDPTALCEYDAILGIFSNNHVPLSRENKYITCDIARFGSDKAVILVWNNWTVVEYHVFDISKTTDIQACINAMRIKHQIPIRNVVCDEDGVGGGVVDSLNCQGFLNGSKAVAGENYFNLQSQCCYKLAEKINASEIYFRAELSEQQKEEITEELEQLKEYPTGDNAKLRILPKEKVRENIGRSPDWRDALMMRAYFDLPIDTSWSVY